MIIFIVIIYSLYIESSTSLAIITIIRQLRFFIRCKTPLIALCLISGKWDDYVNPFNQYTV